MDALSTARLAASRYLADRGYDAEARIIGNGGGDDFAEVRIALHLIALQDERMARYERALRAYADPDFFEDDIGRIARHALAGEDAPVQFHD